MRAVTARPLTPSGQYVHRDTATERRAQPRPRHRPQSRSAQRVQEQPGRGSRQADRHLQGQPRPPCGAGPRTHVGSRRLPPQHVRPFPKLRTQTQSVLSLLTFLTLGNRSGRLPCQRGPPFASQPRHPQQHGGSQLSRVQSGYPQPLWTTGSSLCVNAKNLCIPLGRSPWITAGNCGYGAADLQLLVQRTVEQKNFSNYAQLCGILHSTFISIRVDLAEGNL